MMKLKRIFILGLLTVPTSSLADEPSISLPAITVAPFAVPVAVPVAIVQRPTLFYGVSGYAVGGASSMPTRTQLASPAVSDEPLREQAAAVLKRRCAECHQGTQAQGGLALFDDDGRLELLLPRHLLLDATEPSAEKVPAMPPGGREKLSHEEWQILKQWARMPKSFVY